MLCSFARVAICGVDCVMTHDQSRNGQNNCKHSRATTTDNVANCLPSNHTAPHLHIPAGFNERPNAGYVRAAWQSSTHPRTLILPVGTATSCSFTSRRTLSRATPRKGDARGQQVTTPALGPPRPATDRHSGLFRDPPRLRTAGWCRLSSGSSRSTRPS